MNKHNHQSYHFDCECLSEEHIFRIISENALDNQFQPELYISLQLKQYRSFFKRFIVAIKYIFGYECKLGHWDMVIPKEEDLNKIITIFHQHRVKLENFYLNKDKSKCQTMN